MIIVLFVFGFIFGWLFGRRRPLTRRAGAEWINLPSGWSKNIDQQITAYAMMVDDSAYWWLSRKGRTIIEGPASSILTAKKEVEKAYEDFRC